MSLKHYVDLEQALRKVVACEEGRELARKVYPSGKIPLTKKEVLQAQRRLKAKGYDDYVGQVLLNDFRDQFSGEGVAPSEYDVWSEAGLTYDAKYNRLLWSAIKKRYGINDEGEAVPSPLTK